MFVFSLFCKNRLIDYWKGLGYMAFTSSKEFANILLDGDLNKCWAIIKEYDYSGYSSTFIYDELIANAMKEIGYMWQRNEISVAEEHLATGICEVLLSRYQWEKEKKDNIQAKRVMLFCPEGEHHTLGLKMSASTFEEYGWITKNLGANLPIEHALYMARKWKPDVVAISLTMSYTIPKLDKYINTLTNLKDKPNIIIGSRLINDYSFEMLKDNHIFFLNDQFSLKDWIYNYGQAKALLNIMNGDQR